MTRKPPSGAKHSGCRTHVAHDYARSGWLCITTTTENVAWPESNYIETAATDDAPAVVRIPRDMQPVDRQADMVAFADHLAAVAMAHRSAELERQAIPADPGNGTRPAYVGSPTHIGAPAVVSPKPAKRSRAKVAPEPEPEPEPEPYDSDATMRAYWAARPHNGSALEGSAVYAADGTAAALCDACGEALQYDPTTDDSVGGAWSHEIDYATLARALDNAPASPDPVAPVDALAPESVEPETSSRRDDNGEPDAHGTALAHDFGNPCHCVVCEPVQPCPYTIGRETCIAGPIDHDGAHEYPTVQPCYYYVHTVGVPPIRCDAGLDGHDGAHHYERPGDRVTIEPEPVEPAAVDVDATNRADMAAYIATEPAPATAAQTEPGPVTTAVGRPTCERCGQVFRKHGTGAEWHRVNRPDCAGARPALAIAS